MRIIVLGASHSTRMARDLAEHPDIKNKHTVMSYARAGKNLKDMPLPTNVTAEDIIIAQFFGNNIYDKKSNMQDPVTRNYHLTKNAKNSKECVFKEYADAKAYFDSIPVPKDRIFLIDNPIRYYKCCKLHYSKDILMYQVGLNKEIKKYFQTCVQTVDHRTLLPLGRKASKNVNAVKKLMKDNVHFKIQVYTEMVNWLVKKHLKKYL